MLQAIGIIGLILLFSIAVPLYDKMSYKAMYKQGEKEYKEWLQNK